MNLRQKRITTAIALFLVFSTTQVYVGVSFAGPQPNIVQERPRFVAAEANQPVPQEATGSLTTEGNKPIMVNGAATIGGLTIVTGASIDTPDGVGATVNLGSLGSLQIEPNSKLILEFQKGSVKVMLVQGCVTLRTKKGTSGEVANAQGTIGTSSAGKDGVIRTCPDRGVPVAAAAGGGGGLFGIGAAATISLVALATTIALVPIIQRGGNPSPAGI